MSKQDYSIENELKNEIVDRYNISKIKENIIELIAKNN